MLCKCLKTFLRFVVKGDAHQKACYFEDGAVGREHKEGTPYVVVSRNDDNSRLSRDVGCCPYVTEDVFVGNLLKNLCR